jgi:hypothetical protein
VHLSAGIAQLRPDDDAASFFERADEALYQAEEAGKRQFIAADGLGKGSMIRMGHLARDSRLTTLATGCWARGRSPYHSYCLASSLASFASPAPER